MTDKQVQNLILTGEGYRIEFKKAVGKTFLNEVSAFANSSGGHILLGVSDKGVVEGIDSNNSTRSQIQDALNQLEPRINATIEIKKNIIVVHVPEGSDKPYKSPGGFFMRVGPNSQKMTRNEIIASFQREGRVRFEELVSEKAHFEKDFDPKAFNHFLKVSEISPTIGQEDLLKNLDCLDSKKQLTNLGVLFFAKNIEFIMNHARVDCILFRGTDRVKILDRKEYKGNIIDNIEDTLAFVQRHISTEYIIAKETRREEVSDYPNPALREAITNAICHRDYFTRETPVSVEVFEDRIEIRNPGGLPSGLNLEKFGIQSFPRNPSIASMLHKANYVERAGTGISRIRAAIESHRKKVELNIHNDDPRIYSIVFRKIQDENKKSSKSSNLTPARVGRKSIAENKKSSKSINLTPSRVGRKPITENKKSSKSSNLTPTRVGRKPITENKKSSKSSNLTPTRVGRKPIAENKKSSKSNNLTPSRVGRKPIAENKKSSKSNNLTPNRVGRKPISENKKSSKSNNLTPNRVGRKPITENKKSSKSNNLTPNRVGRKPIAENKKSSKSNNLTPNRVGRKPITENKKSSKSNNLTPNRVGRKPITENKKSSKSSNLTPTRVGRKPITENKKSSK